MCNLCAVQEAKIDIFLCCMVFTRVGKDIIILIDINYIYKMKILRYNLYLLFWDFIDINFFLRKILEKHFIDIDSPLYPYRYFLVLEFSLHRGEISHIDIFSYWTFCYIEMQYISRFSRIGVWNFPYIEIFSYRTFHRIEVKYPISRFSRIELFATSRCSTYRGFLALEFETSLIEIFSHRTFHYIEMLYISGFSRIGVWNVPYIEIFSYRTFHIHRGETSHISRYILELDISLHRG